MEQINKTLMNGYTMQNKARKVDIESVNEAKNYFSY